ncbi:hypothetical protein JW826_02850 [Candidatus Woesearchaeota archaeon]|nr:hypothetical protein [Candidatus Woesearchaeota archaeon]
MVEKRGDLESKVVNKLVLKKAVEHRIRQMSEKAFISEREVYDLIRGFFKKFIGIDYEFTADELASELKKVYMPEEMHERIRSLLDRISEMEHLSRAFSKDELVMILRDFKKLTDDMVVVHYEKKSFFKRLADMFHGSVAQEHKKVLEADTSLGEEERTIVKMNILLDNSRRWSGKDIEASKKAYQDLLVLYDALDEERKKAYYAPVNELYNMLKNKGLQ